MKYKNNFLILVLALVFSSLITTSVSAKDIPTIKGSVVDSKSGDRLVFANITLKNTFLSTVSNSEGHFSLKLPNYSKNDTIVITYLGYETLEVPVSELINNRRNILHLKPTFVSLEEVNIISFDPLDILDQVIERKSENYPVDPMIMTAFYREIIKRKRTYVSISEAVVDVHKQSYITQRKDRLRLLKGRESQDVSKMDTLVFKLQGGPYTSINIDIMKNPDAIISKDMRKVYDFTVEGATKIDEELYYIIRFQQKPLVAAPWFYGRIYVHAQSMAISSIAFNLNVSNKLASSRLFVRKKPMGAEVIPELASYLIKYKQQDGMWYFSYSRSETIFKIDWDKKLFNTVYSATIEMASTDFSETGIADFKASDRLKLTSIMADEINGFSDVNFWGEYNIIEPEQPIERAIHKINRSLKKVKK